LLLTLGDFALHGRCCNYRFKTNNEKCINNLQTSSDSDAQNGGPKMAESISHFTVWDSLFTLAALHIVRRLLVTASVVPSSSILVSLMKESLSSSETSILTRATPSNIPEGATLHSHRRDNLKSYIALTGLTL
jgi:hypothetical protein